MPSPSRSAIVVAGVGVLAMVLVAAFADRGVPAPPAPPPPPPTPRTPPPPPPPHCRPGAVLVEGGTFWMGTPDGVGVEDQWPRHAVPLAPFCMDRTEVTLNAFAACAAAGACPPPPKPYTPCTARFTDRGEHPMNCVDWDEARTFCAWTGGRLPTEAEWEYAARGHDERTYPWGEAPPDTTLVNACGADCAAYLSEHREPVTSKFEGVDGYLQTAPVGSFPRGASPFGVLDMAGNVAEWVESSFDPYGPGATCVMVGYRVNRGGAWTSLGPFALGATRRWGSKPDYRSIELGFRCVHPVEP